MDCYQLAKDFAGPAATVIASATAAGITWRLGRRQVNAAEQQAKIAADKLRHDLFDRRYAIYDSARRLIHLMLHARHDVNPGTSELVPYYVAIKEAGAAVPVLAGIT